jgi:hypothetical protein
LGGLAGANHDNSYIFNCYAAGSVSGKDNDVGGLVGYHVGPNSTIANCYTTNNVNGNISVGGLVGVSWDATIRNCVAANSNVISNENTADINRIAGYVFGNCYNNYALSAMEVRNSGGIVSITGGSDKAGANTDMATLRSLAFYSTNDNWHNEAWNIDVWDICDGKSLPFLRWQSIDCTKTDISEIVLSNIKIFPNPTQNEIFIQSDLQIERVEISSLVGALLIVENNFNEKISLSALPQGVYLLRIYTDKGMVVGKIAKN